jgi:hypothetical protein
VVSVVGRRRAPGVTMPMRWGVLLLLLCHWTDHVQGNRDEDGGGTGGLEADAGGDHRGPGPPVSKPHLVMILQDDLGY